MRLKTPSFWYEDSASARMIRAALLPFGLIYLALRRLPRAAAYKPAMPVICIGNIVAGGSGKTPAALALMKLIQERSLAHAPCFLSRGYGGSLPGPVVVEPARHSFRETGDEPLLLARAAPAIVSRKRRSGAQLAERNAHDLILMDDGHQNTSLVKTLSFVVIDGSSGFGNGLPLPAGPLREPVAAGLARADAFIVIGEDRHHIFPSLPPGKPVFRAKLETPAAWRADTTMPYVAFTGLGRPEKFRESLIARGLTLAAWHPFPDHYPYRERDMEMLDLEAATLGAHLITTEKDVLRLPPARQRRSALDVMPVELAWEEPERLAAFLRAATGAS